MNIYQIADILSQHSIHYTIKNGHIYGHIYFTSDDGNGEEVEDLTGYTLGALLWYLGY